MYRGPLSALRFARAGRRMSAADLRRMVFCNKENDKNSRVRLVARQIRNARAEALFASMPLLKALRGVLSFAATDFEGESAKELKPNSEARRQVALADISRAYFNAKMDPLKPACVAFPPEHPQHGTHCGLLRRHLYGMQAAADGWQREYAGALVDNIGLFARSCLPMRLQV